MSSSNNGQTTTILGNYRVGTNIGQGTFGKVKLGIHIITEQKVAIKTLQKQKIVEQSDIERVTRQICILKILRHPNIIQLYQIIQTKTDIHLIMQYAEGGQLFDYIVKKKRLDQSQAIKFMQQIIAGVQYIHKNGIVHRDLKPQNLLLDHNKNIKIVDFGLSNQYKPGQKLKTACGSPCYAAPQMIAGKKYQCLNADIWSCGIILYAMLCGYLPFEDPNTNKLYRKIIAGDFQMPKILSLQAKQILKNILNVNPQTRFKIQQIRNSKWFNLTHMKYQSKGIIIGKDHIQPNQSIIRKMQPYNMDPIQTRTYVINNRHNHTTALYYLLEIKMQREGKLIPNNNYQHNNFMISDDKKSDITNLNNSINKGNSNKMTTLISNNNQSVNNNNNNNLNISINSSSNPNNLNNQNNKQKQAKSVIQKQKTQRQGSPLIYRPDKKQQYYIPYGKKAIKQVSTTKNNDSLNMSNIISSLVQANKNKLINNKNVPSNTQIKKNDYFSKLEQFKQFPNKKNSSIYEPSSASKMSTSLSKNDDKSFQFNSSTSGITNRNSLNGQQNRKYTILNNHQNTILNNLSISQQYNKDRTKESNDHINKLNIDNVTKQTPTKQNQHNNNKTREQFSDQLRQISIKIDQEINQLKKQSQNQNNNQSNCAAYTSRDSMNNSLSNMGHSLNLTHINNKNNNNTNNNTNINTINNNNTNTINNNSSNYTPSSDRRKSQGPWFNNNHSITGSKQIFSNHRDSMTSSQQITQPRQVNRQSYTRDNMGALSNRNNTNNNNNNNNNINTNTQQSQPKIHIGPFNTQCIFMQSARSLISKVGMYLSKNNMRYSQIQPFNLLMGDGERIFVQNIQGLNGVSLVKFTNNANFRLNQAVIQLLSR